MWAFYRNGNTVVSLNLKTGTKIRETQDDEFKPAFAENLDVKITDACDCGCPMCYEGSTPDGKHSDIMNQKWLDTLHPYQEIALGGGNVLEYPDLVLLLHKLKNKNVIANLTVNQKHFLKDFDLIKQLYDEGLVHGIGVSLVSPTEELIEKVRQIPTVVIHTIAGVTPLGHYLALRNKKLKILILGYKDLRRGLEYRMDEGQKIDVIQKSLRQNLHQNLKDWKKSFATISFDNLALTQLRMKEVLSKDEWERFYQGEEGSQTFYIDAVKGTFSESSVAPMNERYELLDSVDEMFKVIQNKAAKEPEEAERVRL